MFQPGLWIFKMLTSDTNSFSPSGALILQAGAVMAALNPDPTPAPAFAIYTC